ncbi:N-acetyl-gamma-glutamyl-phosphate reductase [Neolewinella lacunae]|uniref:N-acetyl-gamma-glutamyl-phosphate reductase n=1 Tax=Neolewinella lacunae TaxID=1517758 RepID=A0A923PJ08_9BACT|nr:N-acetyl-gamma-glutamyl-phosphate reductase [Neolewinella lacunae]MBC6994199.1 N-acetyl-gamma-glutamyl-phosphate reductase [Neolewinella lacunae]MDN3634642.1 N-acetyl-gamma-glutamyl-phosphate reductase [Neolewinella lacunae]
MKKARIGIIGGGGYTAGELLRLLVHHPGVEVAYIQSESQAGKPVATVHTDLIGEQLPLFSGADAGALEGLTAVFLCMGHGRSREWMDSDEVPATTVVVDLSADFRLDEDWVYGLPEINRAATVGATRIANPGCFATAIQLALLPLVQAGLAEGEVHINGITGSTGAGQQPTETSHFSWRTANVSIYKAFDHQHLHEINRSARQLGRRASGGLNFLPVRGPFARGIYVSTYVQTDASAKQLRELFHDFYATAAFTHVTEENPDLKQVVNTNKGLVYVEKHGDKALVISLIDNLLKGASGQAVQNLNLALGLEETAGLQLKAGVY